MSVCRSLKVCLVRHEYKKKRWAKIRNEATVIRKNVLKQKVKTKA